MSGAPVQPKKPAGGAYGQFMNEKRADFAAQTKGQPVSVVSKLGGEAWKKLSDAEKAPYQKAFEEAKKKYDADMEAFLAAGGVKQKGMMALRAEKRKAKEGKAARKAAKDPNKPQRPIGGAFKVYLDKHRVEIVKELGGGKPCSEIPKAASAKWKALTEAEKEPYEKEYQAKVEEFKKAMESYEPPAKPEGEQAEEPPAKKAKVDKEAKKAAAEAKKAEKAVAKDSKAKAKGRAKAKAKAPEAEPVEIPQPVLAKAEKEDMVEVLTKLMKRDDIKNAGVAAGKALDALTENNGLLHPARRSLLGA